MLGDPLAVSSRVLAAAREAAGLGCRGCSRSLGTRAGTGNGALGLPGAEEAPAERSRAGKGRASPAAAPSGRAGTSARSSPAGPGRAFSLAEEGPRAGSGPSAGAERGGGMRGQCAICHRRVAARPGAPPRALIYAECALEDLDVDFVFLCQSQVKRNSWPEFLAPIIN